MDKGFKFRINSQYIGRIRLSKVKYLGLNLNECLSWSTYLLYFTEKEIKPNNWFTFKSLTFYFSTSIKNIIL